MLDFNMKVRGSYDERYTIGCIDHSAIDLKIKLSC